MNDIEKRIEELTNELNYHNHKYYVDDAPEISDFAFDKMLVELEQLEEKYPEYKKKNSPTVRVGGEAVKSFGEVHHDVPMLSQQKAFSKEEILDFDRRVRAVVHDVNYVVEQKIDGCLFLLNMWTVNLQEVRRAVTVLTVRMLRKI